MIRALVFDFDGLILDTETTLIDAWALVHEEAGLACDRNHALKVVGHVDIPHDPWVAFGPDVDREALERKYRQLRHDVLSKQVPLPGVVDCLNEARRQGLRLAIASNSSHNWVDRHLGRLGLFGYFDLIRCREDVTHGKPEPDLYLSVLNRLELRGAEAIAFEDSHAGSLAAKRAGLRCVAVPNPSTLHHDFSHVDLKLGSLAELSLEKLLGRILGDFSRT